MNLPVNVGEEEEEELRTMLAQLEYGNKISILRWAFFLYTLAIDNSLAWLMYLYWQKSVKHL